MKKKWLSVIFAASALMLAACGGDDEAVDSTKPEGERLVYKTCSTCHGGQLQGMGNVPALNDMGAHMTEEEILDVILNGAGKGMPAGLLKGEEAEKAAEWLSQQK